LLTVMFFFDRLEMERSETFEAINISSTVDYVFHYVWFGLSLVFYSSYYQNRSQFNPILSHSFHFQHRDSDNRQVVGVL
jgi:hypothetical protein